MRPETTECQSGQFPLSPGDVWNYLLITFKGSLTPGRCHLAAESEEGPTATLSIPGDYRVLTGTRAMEVRLSSGERGLPSSACMGLLAVLLSRGQRARGWCRVAACGEAAGTFGGQEPPPESSGSPLAAGVHPRPWCSGASRLGASLPLAPCWAPACPVPAAGGHPLRTGSPAGHLCICPLPPHPCPSSPPFPKESLPALPSCQPLPPARRGLSLSLQGHTQTMASSRFRRHLGAFTSRPSHRPLSSCRHSPGQSPQGRSPRRTDPLCGPPVGGRPHLTAATNTD